MTAPAVIPYQPGTQAGRDRFPQLLRSEWTKFRTVRGWVIGMVVAALVTVVLGLLITGGGSNTCQSSPTSPVLSGAACLPRIPVGPGGQAVTDQFYFVRQPLTGNGSITVRVTSLTGLQANGNAQAAQAGPGLAACATRERGPTVNTLMPWLARRRFPLLALGRRLGAHLRVAGLMAGPLDLVGNDDGRTGGGPLVRRTQPRRPGPARAAGKPAG
jgi:hypothetical protein